MTETAVPRETAGGPARDVLTRTEARDRSRRVDEVAYELALELSAGRDSYRGRAVVEFSVRADGQPLFLDFGGRVTSLLVNGEAVEPRHDDPRIHLPESTLQDRNRVVVEYVNAFDRSGEGLHRFVDPEDGLEYLYTNFEPFAAHRVFPAFDQPDVKATYQLTATAPADWRVVSSEPVAVAAGLPDGRRRLEFRRTPRFSTYVFALVAGPWERVGGEHRGLDLGLFGRRSMRRELERSADELLEVTSQGIDYFSALFDQPFPFRKYDQLFVPEFNAGAMENVAAVTFDDSYLFRDPPTWVQRLLRAEVVLHELAHMWFGDLVTMRWWDDLWLNETFATYLSYRCLAGATRFEDAWRTFNGEMRPAAHRADQLPTTHPVAADVSDTDEAVGNFDAITYEKGAAVMRQLVAALGEDVFREGIRLYFRRHAWGNATLADFLAALGEAAGRPLDDWARVWLQTPSLNTIGIDWIPSQGALLAAEAWQTAPAAYSTLRPHAFEVAFVSRTTDGDGMRVTALPVRLEGPRASLPSAAGLPEPVFVYPDHGDLDYALHALDPASLAFALEHLPRLDDALLRQQTWSTLWDMVRAGSLRATDFLAAVLRFAPLEDDRGLLGAILDRATTTLARYLPETLADRFATDLVTTALGAVASTPEGDPAIVWLRTAIAAARVPADVERLLRLMDAESVPEGVRLDQEMRWSLVAAAMAHDLPGAAERLAVEAARDRSDRGARAVLRARAARPDPAAKAATWERIHGAGFGSDQLTRAAIAGFQWPSQRELLRPFREPFYAAVRDVFASRDHAFSRSYLRGLVPDRWAEPEVAERLRGLAGELEPREGLLRRQLAETTDDLERAVRIRALALQAEPAA